MADWSLLGVLPVVLTVAGAVALAGLLAQRAPRWWTRRVPLVGAAAVLVAVVVKLVIEDVWVPFPDPVPPLVLVAVAVEVAAVGLALARPAPRLGRRHRPRVGLRRVAHRVGALAAALLVIVAAAAQLNAVYQQYPHRARPARVATGRPGRLRRRHAHGQHPDQRRPGPAARAALGGAAEPARRRGGQPGGHPRSPLGVRGAAGLGVSAPGVPVHAARCCRCWCWRPGKPASPATGSTAASWPR